MQIAKKLLLLTCVVLMMACASTSSDYGPKRVNFEGDHFRSFMKSLGGYRAFGP